MIPTKNARNLPYRILEVMGRLQAKRQIESSLIVEWRETIEKITDESSIFFFVSKFG